MRSFKIPSTNLREINWDDPLNKGLVCWVRPKYLKSYDDGVSGDPNADLVGRSARLVDKTSAVTEVTGEMGLAWDKPSSNHIRIRDSIPELDGEQMSWGGWVRPMSTGATYWANNYDLGGASSEHIIQTNGSQVSLYFRPYGGFLDGGSLTFTVNRWHHFFGVINTRSQFIGLYVDGKLVSEGTLPSGAVIETGTQSWAIGCSAMDPSSRTQKGQVGDHRWYNRALSSREVAELYVASRNGYKDQFRRRVLPLVEQGGPIGKPPLDAEAGSFTLAGSDAPLKADRKAGAETGSLTLSGGGTELSAERKLSADSGSFTLGGNDATLTKTTDRTLAADSGSFALTGSSATLKVSRKVVVDNGEFTLTGNNATLNYSAATPSLEAETGSFALAGSDAGLKVNRKIQPVVGSFTAAGSAAELRRSRSLVTSSGAFTVNGNELNLDISRAIVADTGSFLLAGTDTRLRYSGAGITSLIQVKSAFIQSAGAAGSISCADTVGSVVTP